MNRRRVIAIVPDGILNHVLTTEARLDLPADAYLVATTYDPVRLATLLVLTGDQFDEVPEGMEPPIVPVTIIEPTR